MTSSSSDDQGGLALPGRRPSGVMVAPAGGDKDGRKGIDIRQLRKRSGGQQHRDVLRKKEEISKEKKARRFQRLKEYRKLKAALDQDAGDPSVGASAAAEDDGAEATDVITADEGRVDEDAQQQRGSEGTPAKNAAKRKAENRRRTQSKTANGKDADARNENTDAGGGADHESELGHGSKAAPATNTTGRRPEKAGKPKPNPYAKQIAEFERVEAERKREAEEERLRRRNREETDRINRKQRNESKKAYRKVNKKGQPKLKFKVQNILDKLEREGT